MAPSPMPLLADLKDLVESLVPIFFVIIYLFGGVMKSWLENRDNRDRKESLDRIQQAAAKSSAAGEMTPPSVRPQTPRENPVHLGLSEPARPTMHNHNLPYAPRPSQKPEPAATPRPTLQDRLMQLRQKREQYLHQISERERVASKSRPAPSPSHRVAVAKPKSAGMVDPSGGRPKLPKRVQPSKPLPARQNMAEIRSILKDPERLRSALLLKEILGKPISLRDRQGF